MIPPVRHAVLFSALTHGVAVVEEHRMGVTFVVFHHHVIRMDAIFVHGILQREVGSNDQINDIRMNYYNS